jgi:hypothetical protein
VPFADLLYACDIDYWQCDSGRNALKMFKGEIWTQDRDAERIYNINWVEVKSGSGLGSGFLYSGGDHSVGGNSGFQALNMALQMGFDEIYLCGFSMGAGNGIHWHEDHEGNNPNATLFKRWARCFDDLPAQCKEKITIVGESGISCFKKVATLWHTLQK